MGRRKVEFKDRPKKGDIKPDGSLRRHTSHLKFPETLEQAFKLLLEVHPCLYDRANPMYSTATPYKNFILTQFAKANGLEFEEVTAKLKSLKRKINEFKKTKIKSGSSTTAAKKQRDDNFYSQYEFMFKAFEKNKSINSMEHGDVDPFVTEQDDSDYNSDSDDCSSVLDEEELETMLSALNAVSKGHQSLVEHLCTDIEISPPQHLLDGTVSVAHYDGPSTQTRSGRRNTQKGTTNNALTRRAAKCTRGTPHNSLSAKKESKTVGEQETNNNNKEQDNTNQIEVQAEEVEERSGDELAEEESHGEEDGQEYEVEGQEEDPGLPNAIVQEETEGADEEDEELEEVILDMDTGKEDDVGETDSTGKAAACADQSIKIDEELAKENQSSTIVEEGANGCANSIEIEKFSLPPKKGGPTKNRRASNKDGAVGKVNIPSKTPIKKKVTIQTKEPVKQNVVNKQKSPHLPKAVPKKRIMVQLGVKSAEDVQPPKKAIMKCSSAVQPTQEPIINYTSPVQTMSSRIMKDTSSVQALTNPVTTHTSSVQRKANAVTKSPSLIQPKAKATNQKKVVQQTSAFPSIPVGAGTARATTTSTVLNKQALFTNKSGKNTSANAKTVKKNNSAGKTIPENSTIQESGIETFHISSMSGFGSLSDDSESLTTSNCEIDDIENTEVGGRHLDVTYETVSGGGVVPVVEQPSTAVISNRKRKGKRNNTIPEDHGFLTAGSSSNDTPIGPKPKYQKKSESAAVITEVLQDFVKTMGRFASQDEKRLQLLTQLEEQLKTSKTVESKYLDILHMKLMEVKDPEARQRVIWGAISEVDKLLHKNNYSNTLAPGSHQFSHSISPVTVSRHPGISFQATTPTMPGRNSPLLPHLMQMPNNASNNTNTNNNHQHWASSHQRH